jgi:hypothetical protein
MYDNKFDEYIIYEIFFIIFICRNKKSNNNSISFFFLVDNATVNDKYERK